MVPPRHAHVLTFCLWGQFAGARCGPESGLGNLPRKWALEGRSAGSRVPSQMFQNDDGSVVLAEDSQLTCAFQGSDGLGLGEFLHDVE